MDDETIERMIEEGFRKGALVDEQVRQLAHQHVNGEHMDFGYLRNDEEKHLDVD